MSRVLVTGGTGFLGTYMVRDLVRDGREVVATHLGGAADEGRPLEPSATYRRMDVTDPACVRRVLDECRPEEIYHFAGQAFVQPSWERPAETFRVNLDGTLHLLEWIRRASPATSLLFAGSGTEYGAPTVVPTPEEAPLLPTSPYAASKAAADLLCYQYHESFDLRTFRCRIFGTTGPGKTGDASNDFARQIAAIEANGRTGEIRVGNLDKRRDIQDVRDATRAFRHIVAHGEAGAVYNVGRGETQTVRAILDRLLAASTAELRVRPDPTRVRLVDEPVHLADVSRLRAIGWAPSLSFETTLKDILAHWRSLAPAGRAG